MYTPQLINLETTACKLAMSGHGTLKIVSVYLPSSKKLLRSDLESLLALGRKKAECLANSIERQCSHTSPSHDLLHTSRVEEKVHQKVSLNPKDDLDPVTLDEIKGLVKNLKTRKAPGLDGISNKAIEFFYLPLLTLLVAIFNACLKKCYFPEMWKDADIPYHRHSKTREATRPPR
ncbi:RNA-directed DNA polymerase from mobile element jockey [Eumeta japonica]|uniref:RNA-directed DNA polymerase from mobile element jockey n=1 Tax=Eumeta variegata TaxID=151549 RepID=A0A4C1TJ02_EUMVA|nr:RNA-directed DNA polymerase from mobile element jockey [Eumeta japonica]